MSAPRSYTQAPRQPSLPIASLSTSELSSQAAPSLFGILIPTERRYKSYNTLMPSNITPSTRDSLRRKVGVSPSVTRTAPATVRPPGSGRDYPPPPGLLLDDGDGGGGPAHHGAPPDTSCRSAIQNVVIYCFLFRGLYCNRVLTLPSPAVFPYAFPPASIPSSTRCDLLRKYTPSPDPLTPQRCQM